MKRYFGYLFTGAFICVFALYAPSVYAAKAKEKVLHSFGKGSDGQLPAASLIDVKGVLYGTTSDGGSNSNCEYENGCGTVFSLDPKTGAESLLYSFGSGATDGDSPASGLIDVKGTLYGTTTAGGSTGCSGFGCGTVFAVDSSTGAEGVVYSFCNRSNCPDGATPSGGLIDVHGTLYGVTANGGADGFGAVFSVDPGTGTERVLHSFGSGTDGQRPGGNLLDEDGNWYGTTFEGGANCQGAGGCGTVFSIDPKTGAETVLHSFGSGTDGQYPVGGLIDMNGTLYGTTPNGGAYGYGTVFALELKAGVEKIVHSFGGADGLFPDASLIDGNGLLYGTTVEGGTHGLGTAFSVDPETGSERVLYSFGGGSDGQEPTVGLIDQKGTLYGTTGFGGIYGVGTAFSLKP